MIKIELWKKISVSLTKSWPLINLAWLNCISKVEYFRPFWKGKWHLMYMIASEQLSRKHSISWKPRNGMSCPRYGSLITSFYCSRKYLLPKISKYTSICFLEASVGVCHLGKKNKNFLKKLYNYYIREKFKQIHFAGGF